MSHPEERDTGAGSEDGHETGNRFCQINHTENLRVRGADHEEGGGKPVSGGGSPETDQEDQDVVSHGDDTHKSGLAQEFEQMPLAGNRLGDDVIVSERKHRTVVEDCDEHKRDNGNHERLGDLGLGFAHLVFDPGNFLVGEKVCGENADDCEEEKEEQLSGFRDTEDHVVAETLEDSARDTDTYFCKLINKFMIMNADKNLIGIIRISTFIRCEFNTKTAERKKRTGNDNGETVVEEDNVGGGTGSICAVGDGNT